MFINFVSDRQALGFMCIKDIEDQKQVTKILKTGVIYITISILVTSDLRVSNQNKQDESSPEKVILVKDEITSTQSGLLHNLRGGTNKLPESKTEDQLNKELKESFQLERLEKNLTTKSVEDSKSWTGKSFNKTAIAVINKIEPIITNKKFIRLLAETQKPLKSELRISVEPIIKSNTKSITQKSSGKKSSSIFAEALVPINPARWPAFTAGSVMASDMPNIREKLQTPFNNLLVAKEYLETAQSDIQWRDRVWQVAEDTGIISLTAQLGSDSGSFLAGALSNQMADTYMKEMVITEASKNLQEKLNLEIFKQTAREKNLDASKVRGTGVTREFVPLDMQEDICQRPERNARPNSWEDPSSKYDAD